MLRLAIIYETFRPIRLYIYCPIKNVGYDTVDALTGLSHEKKLKNPNSPVIHNYKQASLVAAGEHFH